MTELEKLDAGLEYDFWDEGVNARNLHAIEGCAKLNAIPVTDDEAREAAIRELFGEVGRYPTVLPVFNCDNGRNIRVGHEFLTNYNVTILDIAPVTVGDHVMIGPHLDHNGQPSALSQGAAGAFGAGQAGEDRK